VSDLLSSLNDEQQKAVQHYDGPALVIAGAGSGKTKTVVHRIAYLMQEHGVYPQQILAVTFTNKAAGELKERVTHLIGPPAKDLWVSTFHSACLRILRTYGDKVGLQPGFGIYDDNDQLDMIKEVMDNVDGLADTNPRILRAVIDRAKSNGWKPEEFIRKSEHHLPGMVFNNMISGIPLDIVADVFARYESRLRRANSVDFNDILGRTVDLFQDHPDVLDKVQQRAVFVHVDEYQDTNHVQYLLTQKLADKYRNLMVVGDPDQCLPVGAKIYTPRGCVNIQDLQEGDKVLGTGGGTKPLEGTITHVKRGHYKGNLWKIRAGGRTLQGTPHHVVLARHVPQENKYYVYLMYRADRGYRIGYTKGLRKGDEKKDQPGFIVRLNQEHGDKLWILRTCSSSAEARYWESLFSTKYSVPTVCFHGIGRNLTMDEVWIKQLYQTLDTRSAAERLMRDLWLHPDFPHHRPQGGGRRQTVNLVMFQGNAPNSGVHYHRIQWHSNRPDLLEKLHARGLPIRSNGKGKDGYRVEVARKDYREALDFTKQIAEIGNMDIQRRAQVNGKTYGFTPLSHVQPGMKVLVEQKGQLTEADVDDITQTSYDGPVFDLEVDPLHTYLADGVLVHNSIYSFRAADIRNILDFQNDYDDAKVYRLELNYRSVGNVLSVANALIMHNAERLEKDLKAVKGEGDKVKLYRATDHRAEADFVARQVERLQASKDFSYKDFAILYRTNSQSRVLEESLRRASIPAKIIGGIGFYERREVKDMLSYARAALNPGDDMAWRRILNRPKRGVGKTSEENLVKRAGQQRISFSEALRHAEEVLKGTPAVRKISEFLDLMKDLSESTETMKAAEFLKFVYDQSGYMQMLKDEASFESQERLENLEELLNAVYEWQEEHGGSISEFLDEAALMASVDDRAVKAMNNGEVNDAAVTLMTLHNAKGLEFPVVFLVGMEENLIPHRSSTNSLQDIEEERRLLYVGITRAQEDLFLVNCESRMTFGRTEIARPSRFLEDIPKTMLQEIDVFGQELDVRNSSKYSRPVWTPPVVPSANGKSDSNGVSYHGGEKVKHPRFGEGTVVGVSGEGNTAEVTVIFKEAGAKRLSLKFANLNKV
jgi:DNA helicase II / ATP-dependent DNA helicase PcrA